jgi:hypothetical protein
LSTYYNLLQEAVVTDWNSYRVSNRIEGTAMLNAAIRLGM